MNLGKASYAKSFIGLVAILAIGAGCSAADSESSETVGTNQKMSYEHFKTLIYQEPDTGIYIVDGDTPIHSEAELRAFYDRLPTDGALIVHQSGGSDAKWSATQAQNITYCVSKTSFGSNYNAAVSAMNSAAGAWEAAAKVNFVHKTDQDSNCTASNSNVVFDVRQVNSGGQYTARAFFPDDSRGDRNVLIDTSAFRLSGAVTLTGVLRHELGHTLGFRHEHTRPESGTCFEDNNWRSLTTYDSASVMHYPQCNGSNSGDLALTSKDKSGAAALYGAP